jgi:predicted O-linked N-acetylglucosamine transferase (SPINDLY family)
VNDQPDGTLVTEDRSVPATPETRLLSVCAKLLVTQEEEAEIRRILNDSLDWTLFAQTAVDRGVASLGAYTLLQIAPDMLPHDIRDALHAIIEQTRARNRVLLDELDPIDALDESKDLPAAKAAAERALSGNPNDATPWRNFAEMFLSRGRYKEAIACCNRVLELRPDEAASWRFCARAMAAIGQSKPALTYVDKALALDPQDADAWTMRAQALVNLRRFAEAVEASDLALALRPENASAIRAGIHGLLFSCDWPRREELERRIRDGVNSGLPVITPFNHLAISESEADNLAVARIWAKGVSAPKPLWRGESYRHDKIRIAYLSSDFRDTLSTNAIAGCFECHDKTRFETTAISLSPEEDSPTRRRIEAAFDRFIDVRAMSDSNVAGILRELEVDIAIDTNGYAGGGRSGILAHRPAPVQVNYLGFPGTTGMPFFDYIIADRIVIPEDHRIHYSEKVVYLPRSYFPTDRKREIANHTPSRSEAGLPETSFVFACHNTSYKISPEMFAIWMRLLRTIEKSVLWLNSTIPDAMDVLRREARARGVAPERLVFAARVPERADHLARLRLADLFLDTLPYNAHTTACDALWAGLPVVTCLGNTFPARVAASLLNAAGLPELVTSSLAEYEELALALGQDPQRLAAIKSKLRRNRDTEPLFDTALFTRHLESALITMWERQQAGLAPSNFAVAG